MQRGPARVGQASERGNRHRWLRCRCRRGRGRRRTTGAEAKAGSHGRERQSERTEGGVHASNLSTHEDDSTSDVQMTVWGKPVDGLRCSEPGTRCQPSRR